MTQAHPNHRQSKKGQIAKFIADHGSASKSEIASALHISMPTVLGGIRELETNGIVTGDGIYHSTGGRKPRVYTIRGDTGYAVGIDITSGHLSLALVNLKQELLRFERFPVPFRAALDYFVDIQRYFTTFLDSENIPISSILGVGLSLPGIVDDHKKLLMRSHILGIQDFRFAPLEELLGVSIYLENDANCAACAEQLHTKQNVVYLSLSDSVGGAVYLDGKLYRGDKNKAGEFGHIITEAHGKPCYCGKHGCLDAYCSAKVLQAAAGDSLEEFFQQLYLKDSACMSIWNDYLEHLAVAVSNLRIAFDCDIILGGYMGGFLQDYRLELINRIKRYNNFDSDTSYLRIGRFKQEASAYGITRHFIDSFFDRLA